MRPIKTPLEQLFQKLKSSLLEALPAETIARYDALAKKAFEQGYLEWPDNPYDKWFKDGNRIYLKVEMAEEEEDDDDDSVDKLHRAEIETALTTAGYEIIDFENNKCQKTGETRQPNITKVLARIDKTGRLVNKFNALAQSMSKNKEKKVKIEKIEGKLVVISRLGKDIAGMTSGRKWEDESCMRLPLPGENPEIYGGAYHYAVDQDVVRGTLVAYYLDETDKETDESKEIENPIGRMLIKPYYTSTGKVFLRLSTRVYPTRTPDQSFPELARRVVKKWLADHQGDITEFAKFKEANRYLARGSGSTQRQKSTGLYRDSGDVLVLAPTAPNPEIIDQVFKEPNGAEIVAGWVIDRKLDPDLDILTRTDASGYRPIWKYAESRKLIKAIDVLKYTGGSNTSVLGKALEVSYETNIPRYLKLILRNPELLKLPVDRTTTVLSYLVHKHSGSFSTDDLKKLSAFAAQNEPAVLTYMILQGLAMPPSLSWYGQYTENTLNIKRVYYNCSSIDEFNRLDQIPIEVYTDSLFKKRVDPRSSVVFGSWLMERLAQKWHVREVRKFKTISEVLDKLISKESLAGLGSPEVPVIHTYAMWDTDYVTQDKSLLSIRNAMHSKKTLAHCLAEAYPHNKWIPQDSSILKWKYFDADTGKLVTVRDVLVSRGAKQGQLSNISNVRKNYTSGSETLNQKEARIREL